MFKNSKLNVADNSGAVLLRVTQKYQNRTNPIGVSMSVVLRQFDRTKKLQKKKKYACMVISSKQTVRRKNAMCVRFGENRGMLFSDRDFDKLLGTRVSGPAGREIRRQGLDSSIVQKIAANCVFI